MTMPALARSRHTATPYPHLPHVAVTTNMATLITRSEAITLDRDKLGRIGYGKATLDRLEGGFAISYAEDTTPDDYYVIEYPSAQRYLQKAEWLADQQVWKVETLKRLPDAPR